ncbi:uncharacterized protein SOCE836_028300 [Sorangium cellulosum]|uniref:Uncharacterized protein n=1 Tax=Sorangium cellulosum TaxID=56 RepID=A0A4P2QL06_SORCE|nr:uncharacterized protein SOCE836_028300 [Sorangium cellulosum]WCQ90106.1 hypothetical protein NQZ70_02807 [Sorangium sp. Soce836]
MAACAGDDPLAAMLHGDAMAELRTPRGAVGKRVAKRLLHAGTEAARAPCASAPESADASTCLARCSSMVPMRGMIITCSVIGSIGVDSSASRLCCTRMISACNAARSRSAFSRGDISSASRGLGERLRRRGSARRGPPPPGPPLRDGAAMGDSPAGCRNSRRQRALTAWRAACGVGAVWPARLAPRASSTSAVAPRRRRSTRSCATTWRRCTGPSTTAPSTGEAADRARGSRLGAAHAPGRRRAA